MEEKLLQVIIAQNAMISSLLAELVVANDPDSRPVIQEAFTRLGEIVSEKMGKEVLTDLDPLIVHFTLF